jgi:regulator of protease activity HflC (stomatin/prohibitin superfamily)
VVETIHPPAGAAEAYHAVQSAEISANALVAAEKGRAAATLAAGRQYATEQVTQAQALAAEIVGQARGDAARFAADREGDAAGHKVFVLERYYATLVSALPRVPATIVDSRIAPGNAPVLDLRPPGSPGGAAITPSVRE